MITLLDYGAGNVRSVRNAIKKLGFEVKDVTSPDDIRRAEKLIFPGVGNFSSASFVHIGHNHVFSAFSGKTLTHRAADATGAARYNYDFVC